MANAGDESTISLEGAAHVADLHTGINGDPVGRHMSAAPVTGDYHYAFTRWRKRFSAGRF